MSVYLPFGPHCAVTGGLENLSDVFREINDSPTHTHAHLKQMGHDLGRGVGSF